MRMIHWRVALMTLHAYIANTVFIWTLIDHILVASHWNAGFGFGTQHAHSITHLICPSLALVRNEFFPLAVNLPESRECRQKLCSFSQHTTQAVI